MNLRIRTFSMALVAMSAASQVYALPSDDSENKEKKEERNVMLTAMLMPPAFSIAAAAAALAAASGIPLSIIVLPVSAHAATVAHAADAATAAAKADATTTAPHAHAENTTLSDSSKVFDIEHRYHPRHLLVLGNIHHFYGWYSLGCRYQHPGTRCCPAGIQRPAP